MLVGVILLVDVCTALVLGVVLLNNTDAIVEEGFLLDTLPLVVVGMVLFEVEGTVVVVEEVAVAGKEGHSLGSKVIFLGGGGGVGVAP